VYNSDFFSFKSRRACHFVFLFYFISFLFLFGKLFDDYQMKSQKPLNKAVTVTFSIGI
jgi:hypothetical protein